MTIDHLEQLVAERGAGTTEAKAILADVAARARALGALAGSSGAVIGGLSFVGEALGALAVERAWSSAEVDGLLEEVSSHIGVDVQAARVVVFTRAVADARLMELPPRLGIETRLRLLSAFAAVSEASLWTLGVSRAPTCVVHVGDEPPPRRARALARAVLEGHGDEAAAGARALLHALPVSRWEQPYAALVVKVDARAREGALVLAHEVARTLGAALELDTLLERNAERERSLVDSSERRLVRLGFDLHDGPMQDAAALGAEIRHFREQLDELLADDPRRGTLVGRVDDLEARLRALDVDLRELAQSLNTPVVLRIPFRDILDRELETFERRAGIAAKLRISGDFERLSTSQRVALLRLIQEALANVQNHSGAASVAVTVTAARAHTRATVADDGAGFEVEATLVAAARRGRLGLVGMGERIRLLGGRFDVRSAPGNGTEVTATLPRWRPPEPDGETASS